MKTCVRMLVLCLRGGRAGSPWPRNQNRPQEKNPRSPRRIPLTPWNKNAYENPGEGHPLAAGFRLKKMPEENSSF